MPKRALGNLQNLGTYASRVTKKTRLQKNGKAQQENIPVRSHCFHRFQCRANPSAQPPDCNNTAEIPFVNRPVNIVPTPSSENNSPFWSGTELLGEATQRFCEHGHIECRVDPPQYRLMAAEHDHEATILFMTTPDEDEDTNCPARDVMSEESQHLEDEDSDLGEEEEDIFIEADTPVIEDDLGDLSSGSQESSWQLRTLSRPKLR